MLAAGVVVSALFLAGCGYGFAAGPGLATVAAGKKVAVGALENRSLEADAGARFTRELGRALAARGVLGDGDAVLTGTIDLVNAIPVGIVVPQNVQLWRAELRLRVELRAGAKVLGHAALVETEDYRSGDDVEATETSRKLAMARLYERAANDALDRLAP